MFSDPLPGSRHKRTLIRPLEINKNTSNNIFASTLRNPEDFSPSELHHLVGDNDWKRSTYHNLMPKKQTIILSDSREQLKALNNSMLKGSESSRRESSIIPISSQHSMNNTCATKFCLDQIDKDTREHRVIEKYTHTQSGWKDAERGLLTKVKRNKSISYNAVKDIYMHPNPDKLALINDNIPQYWQHSLRDNCKTLYKHLRNNPFKKEAAEEMMQTLAGRRKLQESIPQLKTVDAGLSLKGKSTRVREISCRASRFKAEETFKSAYGFKEKWLNEISYTQTSSTFGMGAF